MSNTTKLLERILSGGCNMGWISDAEAEEIRALAAPVASAAPSGELPPVPKELHLMSHLTSDYYLTPSKYDKVWEIMQAYARAAIAHQPPKEALTDAEIFDLYSKSHVEYDATVLVRNPRTEEDEYKTEKQSCFSPTKFADAIIAASAPNKQLVEALKELCAMYGSTWDSVDGSLVMFAGGITRFEKAHAAGIAALAAAGEKGE